MNNITTKKLKPGNVYSAIGEDKAKIPFRGMSFYVVEILRTYDNLTQMRLITKEGNKIYFLLHSNEFKLEDQ